MSNFVGASTSFRLEHKGLHADGVLTLETELPFLRQRSRWLIRNDGYATAAMAKSASNWIGTGLKGKWDNPELQALWEDFIAQPTLDGVGTFASYQLLLAHSIFQSGELFTRIHFVAPDDTTRLPFSIEAIEADYCPIGVSDAMFGEAKPGISYSKKTRAPQTYRFYNRTQTDIFDEINPKLISVPAARIVHTFEATRPGQRRGFPFLTPAILPLWELQDLTDATIMRQKAAQAVGWIVEKQEEMKQFNPLGEISDVMPQPQVYGIHTGVAASTQPTQIETITPGGVHYFNKGETVKWADPTDIGSNLVVMIKFELRKLASALGILYEQLTGDLTQVNYSSIRAGLIDFYARVEQIQQLLIIAKGLQPIADKFKAFASAWKGTDFSAAKIKWIPPKKMWVDPLKDVKADMLELEGETPLATWQDKVEERGKDFDDHLKQIEKEKQHRVIPETTTETGTAPSNTGGESGSNTEGDAT